MAPQSGNTTTNRLLSALPADDLGQLWPSLQRVVLSHKQVLYHRNAPIAVAHFVEQGVVSVLTVMTDGAMGEVGMIGCEGMIGAPLVLGADTSSQYVIVQIPGTALQLSAAACKATFDRHPSFRAAVLHFVDAFVNLGAQTAACNLHHTAEQRCARWLLMARERIQTDTMLMTHEFLSMMLGVRRTGVTAIASALQRAGLIQYHRGRLRIINRDALEAAACECYRIDRDRISRLP
jgi:CRP-like cAMP-binding protein